MMKVKVSIGFSEKNLEDKAQFLSLRLDLPIDNQVFPRLNVTPERLELLAKGFSPLYVDFSQTSWQKRHKAGKKQGLVQACKPHTGMSIIDVTAGWGRDAAILASFGADVLMIERNPIMAALLEDGLRRLEASSSLHARLSLHQGDARDYLKNLDENTYPDVIYIDPMHPERQKSALVKKDMQILQQLLGSDDDAQDLLNEALQKARQKVVVKWPQRANPLGHPLMSFDGKTVRFDVYKP